MDTKLNTNNKRRLNAILKNNSPLNNTKTI